jgi:hypothetical protein
MVQLREGALLRQIANDSGPHCSAHRRITQTGKGFQQSRLAGTVATDQPHLVPRVKGKRRLRHQRADANFYRQVASDDHEN